MAAKEKLKAKPAKKPSIWQYVGHYKGAVAAFIFLTVLSAGLDVLLTLIMAQMLVLVTDSNISGAIVLLLYGLIALLVVQIVDWLSNFIYAKYTSKISAEMNLALAKQVFKLTSKSFADHDTGTFVQRIVNDPQRLASDLASLVSWFIAIVEQVVICVYVCTFNPWIALVIAGFLGIGIFVAWLRAKARIRSRSQMFRAADKVDSLTTEIVRSEKDIKSLGLEEQLSKISEMNYNNYAKKAFKFTVESDTFNSIWYTFRRIGMVVLMIVGLVLMDYGTLVLASFMIIYSYRNEVFDLATNLGEFINFFSDIGVSHKRIFSLFDEDEYVTEKFGSVNMEISGGAEIEFKDVGFSYKEFEYAKPDAKLSKKEKREKKKNGIKPQKKLVSENKVFEDLSFKIERNTTVAFVGRSGSGKSTILDLMSKMYEVDSGEVLINGVNINDLSKESLRSNISLVNQFPYIFDMTIKDNLLLANENASDEDIERALKNSSLDEFVATLPKGVNTKVGESGIKLSGGQKQRLAIARAMLRNSGIIIFDESTSSLDNFAQNNVKKSIDNLKGTSTIVIVAHRLSTIRNVDHIFFLEKGKIVDEGTFDELFERNEVFKTMFMAENTELI